MGAAESTMLMRKSPYGRVLHQLDCRCRGCSGGDARKRRVILHATLTELADEGKRNSIRENAVSNVKRWASSKAKVAGELAELAEMSGGGGGGAAAAAPSGVVTRSASGAKLPQFRVEKGDWGDVTSMVTKEYGQIFAVLNMANAYAAGGGYVEGMPAQEENMFRRTDCHYFVTAEDYNQEQDRYHPKKTDLLNAVNGKVFLDNITPRVCIRGSENRQQADLGYPWLKEEEHFPFFELRAAAEDLRYGGGFSPDSCRMRVRAQLETLQDKGIKHAVLSAFGCGAFQNPADQVARIYREELELRNTWFECVTFAIFHPGYGPDNYTPFRDAFA